MNEQPEELDGRRHDAVERMVSKGIWRYFRFELGMSFCGGLHFNLVLPLFGIEGALFSLDYWEGCIWSGVAVWWGHRPGWAVREGERFFKNERKWKCIHRRMEDMEGRK